MTNSTSLYKVILTFWLTSLLVCQMSYARTTIDDLALSSDSMERDRSINQTVLSGNVQIVFGGYHLSADKATIYEKESLIKAQGNVVIQDQTMYSEGDTIVFNYETGHGTITNGFVKAGQVIFEGANIEKTGDKTYLVKDASFTACTTCPAAWSLSGSQIEAEIGGYAWIKYPVMRLANFPIFAFFGIAIPLKSDRQSGFLTPEFYSSKIGGSTISESYFWAIDRSRDLTITARHYENRGWKGLGDYRYVLDTNSYGQLKGAYLYDRAFLNSDGLSDPTGRGFLQYHHYYSLPNDYIQRAQFLYVSDLNYHRDFFEEVGIQQETAISNKTSLTKNLESQHLSVEANLYRNLLKSDPFSDNNDAVHRLPEFRYSLTDEAIKDSGVYFNFDFNYIHFARQSNSYDDVESTGNEDDPLRIKQQKDGVFDPNNDLIRSGHRMILSPGVSYPILLGSYAELVPRASYHEYQYFFNAKTKDETTGYSPSATRRHIQGDLTLRTRLSQIFGGSELDPRQTTYKHFVEPEISYSAIPWVKRPEHNFFGNFEDQPYSRNSEPVTDQDFYGNSRLQFDYRDRLFDKNLVNFLITNRVLRKRWLGEGPTFDNIMTVKISQSYDLNAEKQPTPRPWSNLNVLFEYNLDLFDFVIDAYYHPYAGATSSSSRIKFQNPNGNFVELYFDQSFNIDEDANYVFEDRSENWGSQFGHVSKYFNLTARLDYSPITHSFYKWSYAFTVKPPGDCWGFQLSQQQVFLGDPQTKFNIYFQFGGDSSKLYNF